MRRHIVQSPEWGRFKSEYGTKAYRVGDVQYTIHKIPLTNNYYAYAPKVDPFSINWDELEDSLEENECIAINFDVPNILTTHPKYEEALKIFEEKCTLSPRTTFAQNNILLDIKQPEKKLLANMHKKHRYNIRYAEKKGVTVRQAENKVDFDLFYELLKNTAERQKYYIHPKVYYQEIWSKFHPLEMCHILHAEYEGQLLAAWMLFTYEKTLYYPYGGSSEMHKNLFGSNLVAWEAIKLGKEHGCDTFDMWGAAQDPKNTEDPWYGFTNFKMKFGGTHVTYMDSYDYVIRPTMYNMFNFANDLRWKILNAIK